MIRKNGFRAIGIVTTKRCLLISFELRQPMKYSDLIQLYFDRSSALQWYWTIYVVVIGGLLAFSSLRQRKDAVTAILVTVLYGFFAYKNLGAIRDVTTERLAILSA